jgi:hypothetical protein
VSAQQGGVIFKSTPPDATGKFVLYPVPVGTYDLVITASGRVNAVMTGVPVVTTAFTTLNSASAPLATPPSGSSFAAKGTVTVNASVVDTGGVVRALQPVASGPTIQAGTANANATTGAYRAGAYTLSATATGFATPKTAPITISNADVTTDFTFP